MTLGSLIAGFISLIIGIILYYILLPKTKESVPKQKVTIHFLFRSTGSLFRTMIGSIFMLLGLLRILTFCLGIDGGNYTPDKSDDITVLTGIITGICTLSLERNIAYSLGKFKRYRNRKATHYNDL